jgi:hypothetical protein
MKVSTSIKGAAFSLLNGGSSYRSYNHPKSIKGNNKSKSEAPNELDEEDIVA